MRPIRSTMMTCVSAISLTLLTPWYAMPADIDDLFETRDDRVLCQRVFRTIVNHYGEQTDVSTWKEHDRAVALVWHTAGIIRTGSFHALFEGAIAGDPHYLHTIAAYKAIGAPECAEAIQQALKHFPEAQPPAEMSARTEAFRKSSLDKRWQVAAQYRYHAHNVVEYSLPRFIRKHHLDFKDLVPDTREGLVVTVDHRSLVAAWLGPVLSRRCSKLTPIELAEEPLDALAFRALWNLDEEERGEAIAEIKRRGAEKDVIPFVMEALETFENQYPAVQLIRALGPAARPVVPILIRWLDYEFGRRSAVRAFLLLGPVAEDAIPALTRIVLEDDENRSDAAHALGRIGSAAVPSLREGFRHKNVEVRKYVAIACEVMQENAFPLASELIGLLTEQDVDVRLYACSALSSMGPPVIPTLKDALSAEKPYIRVYSATAILEICRKNHLEIPSTAIDALTVCFKNPDEQVRERAVRAFLDCGPGGRAAVPALAKALADESHEVRYSAAMALGDIGRPAKGAVEPLIKALTDEHEDVRNFSARALALIGPDAVKAVPALIKTLQDECENARDWAAEALGNIGSGAVSAIPALEKAIKEERVSRHIGENAIKKLEGYSKPDA